MIIANLLCHEDVELWTLFNRVPTFLYKVTTKHHLSVYFKKEVHSKNFLTSKTCSKAFSPPKARAFGISHMNVVTPLNISN